MIFNFDLEKKDYVTIFLIIFIFLLIDIIFINYGTKCLWNKTILNIQSKDNVIFRPLFGIPAYFLLILGLILFVYLPNKNKSIYEISIIAFIWGLIVYGVFDFTNLTLFKNYSIKIAIIDIFWGGFVSFISILISLYISNKIFVI